MPGSIARTQWSLDNTKSQPVNIFQQVVFWSQESANLSDLIRG